MKIYLEWSSLSEILQAQNSLKMWWYEWEIEVILKAELQKDIKKILPTFTMDLRDNNIYELFWMKITNWPLTYTINATV